MGQVFNKKDPNIDIHIQVSKIAYLPGQLVKGNIYLNVKKNSQYDTLNIKLLGQQYCYWTTGAGKNKSTFKNKLKTYQYQFLIKTFDKCLMSGQYIYPFNFVLPNQLSGSFFFSQNNYIKYNLQANLQCFNKKNNNQIAIVNLNIKQHLREEYKKKEITKSTNGKCCKYFTNYGMTQISLQCDRNFVKTDQQILVKATIDNSKGSQQIKNVKLVLNMKKIMITKNGRTSTKGSQTFILQRLDKVIKPKQVKQYCLTPTIPNNLIRQTAIGSITAIYYQLAIITQQGCCNSDLPTAKIHLILHSNNNSALIIPKKIDPPNQWNPIVQPITICKNISPFYYSLHQKMANLNLRLSCFIPLCQNTGFKPYFYSQADNPHTLYNYNQSNQYENFYDNEDRDFAYDQQGMLKKEQ